MKRTALALQFSEPPRRCAVIGMETRQGILIPEALFVTLFMIRLCHV